MSRPSCWLLEFKSNVHSQTGEDGVIQKILETLPGKDGWCVEFGAWDGEYLSNVCNLIDSHGYAAVLIECSRKKFKDLRRRYADNGKVMALNRFVGFHEYDNLDVILEDTPIPRDFDFLSIDIDGNDYHVWKSVSRYRPKVVCIEFNPTVPTEVEFVQPADSRLNQGASLLSLVELGKNKGYELVSVLPFNAFFVESEYYPLFQIEDNSPEVLRTDLSAVTHIFSGYDGRVFLRGGRRLPWHAVELRESRFQVLPKCLRMYPLNYGTGRKILFGLYRMLQEMFIFKS